MQTLSSFRVQREDSEGLSSRALGYTRLKAAGTPTISIPEEKSEILYQVSSGLSPYPCSEMVPEPCQPWRLPFSLHLGPPLAANHLERQLGHALHEGPQSRGPSGGTDSTTHRGFQRTARPLMRVTGGGWSEIQYMHLRGTLSCAPFSSLSLTHSSSVLKLPHATESSRYLARTPDFPGTEPQILPALVPSGARGVCLSSAPVTGREGDAPFKKHWVLTAPLGCTKRAQLNFGFCFGVGVFFLPHKVSFRIAPRFKYTRD